MKYPLICFFLLLGSHIMAQNQGSKWYFPDSISIDFISGQPVVLNDGVMPDEDTAEGSASIADNTGRLLFYTNGETIWNRAHQVMQGGDSLYGHQSSTQSALIVPWPKNPDRYVVFTTDGLQRDVRYGLRYTVVDMCLHEGLGGVVKKNIYLVDSTAEKIAATQHNNGVDYWILTHKMLTDGFHAFLLTENGIAEHVITNIGTIHDRFPWGSIGQMKLSPNGEKLAITAGNSLNILEVYDFDDSTGIVSNFVSLSPTFDKVGYGTSFSPNSTKLYFTGTGSGGVYLIQFEPGAGNGDPDSIRDSETLIMQSGLWCVLGLQLGPDRKIYMGNCITSKKLSVINSPDMVGMACDFQASVVHLQGRKMAWSLPGFIDNFNYPNDTMSCFTSVEEVEHRRPEVVVSPQPVVGQSVVSFDGNGKSYTFVLYNSYGEVVLEDVVDSEFTLDGYGLENGLYFYQLMDDLSVKAAGKIMVFVPR